MGESVAASGGVLLNSAYLISSLSMAGPLDATTAWPPIAAPVTPVSAAAFAHTCRYFDLSEDQAIQQKTCVRKQLKALIGESRPLCLQSH